MELGKDFWMVLHAMALHVERSPGEKVQRRRRLVSAYLEFGPIGRRAALEELQLVAAELAALERIIAKSEEGVPVTSDGDGQGRG